VKRDHRTHTPRDAAAFEANETEQWSRLDAAHAAGYDPHPDDLRPPALHLQSPPGIDVLAVFAAEVEAVREKYRRAS